MTNIRGFAYAQARMQARYGQRADEDLWLRLHTLHDLASYMQAGQQSALRPWMLGIGPSHSSHDIELTLRQRFRQHVDEVATWLPAPWQAPLRWIKRLPDLPVLQYLLAGEPAPAWMTADPDLHNFAVDDPIARTQRLRDDGCGELVNAWHRSDPAAWQRGNPLLPAWLARWHQLRPQHKAFEPGLTRIEALLLQRPSLLGDQQTAAQATITDPLRQVFRRHTCEPAAVLAYLGIVAIDLQRLRGELLQRRLFTHAADIAEPAPA